MKQMNFADASANAMGAMLGLEKAVQESSIERSLLHLVKMRVSQINVCAFCMDMHASEARRDGEAPRRLHTLVGWRETNFFSQRERAALAWAEALTHIAPAPGLHEELGRLKCQFSAREIADLTLAIVAINGWNRIAIGFGTSLPE